MGRNKSVIKADNTMGQVVRARYRSVEIPEHKGNPLIEALPSITDAMDLVPTFGHFPKVNKHLSRWGRLQMIDLLDQSYLEPLTNHFEVIQQIFLSIKSGYTFRNLASPEYRKALVRFYHNCAARDLMPLYQWQPASHQGFCLFGCSGVGKSTVIERALSYFPKAIHHPKYKITQMVWVKVDCPPDGSFKQFLLSVIREFDNILGSSYLGQYGAYATDGLIQAVAFLSAYHHLGILVLDEIQHLLDARQNKDAVLLNYLVTLNNTLHIPIGYIGTIRAMSLCEMAFRQARRVGTAFIWDRIQQSADEWQHFLECLWEYQWCEYTDLSDQLSDVMYFHTQGIHALVVRLFQLSQKAALLNNQKISPQLIKREALEKFILLEPMLHSLRLSTEGPKVFWGQKDAKRYEDLIYKTLIAQTEDLLPRALSQALPSNKSEITLTLSALEGMGFDKTTFKSTILKMFDENPLLNASKAVNQFLSLQNTEGEIEQINSQSLTQIVEEAKSSGNTPLQGLQNARLSPKAGKSK